MASTASSSVWVRRIPKKGRNDKPAPWLLVFSDPEDDSPLQVSLLDEPMRIGGARER
jgi:hypothetical protein